MASDSDGYQRSKRGKEEGEKNCENKLLKGMQLTMTALFFNT